MNEAYKEYAREHPEELVRLNTVKRYSDRIAQERKKQGRKEVEEVERWRRILDGKDRSCS